MQYQRQGRGLVRLNYWDALWCLSFCQHGSKARDGDEATGGGEDYVGLADAGMQERVASANTRLSGPSFPQVLNVKCLTGRLSEEELQRAAAPLDPGGGKCRVQGSRSQPGFLSVASCQHHIAILCCNIRYGAAQNQWSHVNTVWFWL